MDKHAPKSKNLRERRFQPRRTVEATGFFRERGRSRSEAHVTDLCSLGCRLRLSQPVIDGDHSWVTLPTLGPWSCSVVWRSELEAGVAFDRPLHRAVATMLCDGTA
jgi:hypothetical protein